MAVTSIAFATTKFPFRTFDCTVDRDAGKGDFSLVMIILHVCGNAHVRSHESQGKDRSYQSMNDLQLHNHASRLNTSSADVKTILSPEK